MDFYKGILLFDDKLLVRIFHYFGKKEIKACMRIFFISMSLY